MERTNEIKGLMKLKVHAPDLLAPHQHEIINYVAYLEDRVAKLETALKEYGNEANWHCDEENRLICFMVPEPGYELAQHALRTKDDVNG